MNCSICNKPIILSPGSQRIAHAVRRVCDRQTMKTKTYKSIWEIPPSIWLKAAKHRARIAHLPYYSFMVYGVCHTLQIFCGVNKAYRLMGDAAGTGIPFACQNDTAPYGRMYTHAERQEMRTLFCLFMYHYTKK